MPASVQSRPVICALRHEHFDRPVDFSGNVSVCQSDKHCLAAISPEQVFNCLQTVLTESKRL
jgi:hypothetical protein